MKKIPMRMCIGCMEMKEKKQLVRIVNNKDEGISLDPTGKKSGRGAYICKNAECFRKAQKARKLEKAFSCRVDESIYAQLESELAGINEYGGAVYEES